MSCQVLGKVNYDVKTLNELLTVNSGLNGFLNCGLKYLSLSPHLNDSPKLLLDLIRSPFIRDSCGFGNDGRESDEEVILPSGF